MSDTKNMFNFGDTVHSKYFGYGTVILGRQYLNPADYISINKHYPLRVRWQVKPSSGKYTSYTLEGCYHHEPFRYEIVPFEADKDIHKVPPVDGVLPQLNQTVYSEHFGWGTINKLDYSKQHYPISVRWDSTNYVDAEYTVDGRYWYHEEEYASDRIDHTWDIQFEPIQKQKQKPVLEDTQTLPQLNQTVYINQPVYSERFGWGSIIELDYSDQYYPISVRWDDKNEDTDEDTDEDTIDFKYTVDGHYLYHEEAYAIEGIDHTSDIRFEQKPALGGMMRKEKIRNIKGETIGVVHYDHATGITNVYVGILDKVNTLVLPPDDLRAVLESIPATLDYAEEPAHRELEDEEDLDFEEDSATAAPTALESPWHYSDGTLVALGDIVTDKHYNYPDEHGKVVYMDSDTLSVEFKDHIAELYSHYEDDEPSGYFYDDYEAIDLMLVSSPGNALPPPPEEIKPAPLDIMAITRGFCK